MSGPDYTAVSLNSAKVPSSSGVEPSGRFSHDDGHEFKIIWRTIDSETTFLPISICTHPGGCTMAESKINFEI